MLVILIDQQGPAIDLLAQRLAQAGFAPEVFGAVADAAASPLRASAQALLLALGGGAPPAGEIIARLRHAGLAQPLVVLSTRDEWRERVAAFDAGADDFLLVPAHSEEVAARLRAAIRRGAGCASPRIAVGDIELDLIARCAWRGQACLALTRNEFRLLQRFLLAPEHVLTKDQIATALWAGNRNVSGNAIEVLVARLRQKLGTGRIATVRGLGYRLADPPAAGPQPAEPAPRQACAQAGGAIGQPVPLA
ncbi:response regulator transcription factor [Novosphingobium bradum]|uniref:Response regulator transcription factor n=1 Tax=Novosphingobium bradum TaxID=1737444 RepID=A0ABV7ISH7_9SPHN